MARVKRGTTTHARHKKVIKQAKGYRGRNKNVFRAAVADYLEHKALAGGGAKHAIERTPRESLHRVLPTSRGIALAEGFPGPPILSVGEMR